MSFLPPGLGGESIIAWRLDQANFAPTWNSGEGAFRVGGRWNSRGTRAVYCSLDPSTAVLEVAVHKGFEALDLVPHVLTACEILDKNEIHVLQADGVPDDDWLEPGLPTHEQQLFGDALLEAHQFVAIPSAVSRHSWNLVFLAGSNKACRMIQQERFVLDPRLRA